MGGIVTFGCGAGWIKSDKNQHHVPNRSRYYLCNEYQATVDQRYPGGIEIQGGSQTIFTNTTKCSFLEDHGEDLPLRGPRNISSLKKYIAAVPVTVDVNLSNCSQFLQITTEFYHFSTNMKYSTSIWVTYRESYEDWMFYNRESKFDCCVESLRLVLIDNPFGEKTHFLSHFDGSCWQLSLSWSAGHGKSKPFGWSGGFISFNGLFTAVSEKSAFACKKARANVFFTYERHIFKFEFLFYAINLLEAHKNTLRQGHILKFEFLCYAS